MALLIDLREWMEDADPGCLEALLVDATIDVCARQAKLIQEVGA